MEIIWASNLATDLCFIFHFSTLIVATRILHKFDVNPTGASFASDWQSSVSFRLIYSETFRIKICIEIYLSYQFQSVTKWDWLETQWLFMAFIKLYMYSCCKLLRLSELWWAFWKYHSCSGSGLRGWCKSLSNQFWLNHPGKTRQISF